jgi:uncharacterized protein (UPF0303 family)
MAADDLERIKAQEAGLVFSGFDEDAAFALGSTLRARAAGERWPIIIDIRFWDRPLFTATLPGCTANNTEWVRRKSETVRRWGRSSYRVLMENRGERLKAPDWGLDPSAYALHGGSFPIRARNFGVIGAVTISGLDERTDHMVAVEGICDLLGVARADYQLSDGQAASAVRST